MPRFFLSEHNFDKNDNNKLWILGEDANHIAKSLRMRPGDTITVCDLYNYEYHCEICSVTDEKIALTVLQKTLSATEPTVKVTLFQALTKSDKFDSVVQKAVELGVARIVPVLTERCISRPDKESGDKKITRWQKISEAAAKQCGRGIIPQIAPIHTFSEALREMADTPCAFLCYENEPRVPLRQVLSDCKESDYAFLIGPEGGLSPDEVTSAVKSGIALVSLGKRILRTETASACVLSAIMFNTGNMD